MLERDAAVDDRRQQARGGAVVHVASHHDRAAQRTRDAVAQALTKRRQREVAALLGEDVLDHEAPQCTPQRCGIGAHRLRDLGGGAGTAGQDVGNAELGRDVEQLRRHVAVHQARDLRLRREIGHCAVP
jgi:hypothetical protein